MPALRRRPDLAAACPWLLQPGQAPRRGAARQPVIASPPAPVITQRLTECEREVLPCAAALLSNEEIASKLHISVNTVKTHLNSILCKLGSNQTTRGSPPPPAAGPHLSQSPGHPPE